MTAVRELLDSLRSPLIHVHKAREAVVETFQDVAGELDGEKVSTKQKIMKVCGRVASIAGTTLTSNTLMRLNYPTILKPVSQTWAL